MRIRLEETPQKGLSLRVTEGRSRLSRIREPKICTYSPSDISLAMGLYPHPAPSWPIPAEDPHVSQWNNYDTINPSTGGCSHRSALTHFLSIALSHNNPSPSSSGLHLRHLLCSKSQLTHTREALEPSENGLPRITLLVQRGECPDMQSEWALLQKRCPRVQGWMWAPETKQKGASSLCWWLSAIPTCYT